MSDMLRILLIDNYDSFTFNLKHQLEERDDVALTLVRNDDDFLGDVADGAFDGVIIGPGPGSPEDEAYFGKNRSVILDHGTKGLPILGVCLGFQGIWHAFGGTLKQAAVPVHGKLSKLDIEAPDPILNRVPEGARVMRYHSILADMDAGTPEGLVPTAWAAASNEFAGNGRELMAFYHRDLPIFGVQYHPESFGTDFGARMTGNFCEIAKSQKG